MTVLTFVGSTLQGAIGFGMGLLAAPVLILLDPRFVPAPILVCTMVLTLLMAYRERHAIDVRGIKWAMLGRIAGTVVAGGILAVAAADTLVLLFGCFILAAVAMGASWKRIVFSHVMPNSFAPYLIVATAALGGAILQEASLSFLGVGVPPPHPSWGRMLSGIGRDYFLIAPWMSLAPGLAIVFVVLAFNLFGDALRDVLDPRLRGTGRR